MTLQRGVKLTPFSQPSVVTILFANSQPRTRRAQISKVIFGRKRDSLKGAPLLFSAQIFWPFPLLLRWR